MQIFVESGDDESFVMIFCEFCLSGGDDDEWESDFDRLWELLSSVDD